MRCPDRQRHLGTARTNTHAGYPPERKIMMSMRFNPPPSWPPVPPRWTPPPGWQPDPSWPDPPPGWNLWIEDTAARDWQIRVAKWTIAAGGTAFFGSLLPFLSSPQPDLYTVNSAPKESAAFFGIILA